MTGSKERDGTVKLWNAATGEERTSYPAIGESIFTTAISPDNRYVFVSYSTIFVHNFDARLYPWVHDYLGSNSQPYVAIWDAHTGEIRGFLSGHTTPVSSIRFSSDGKRILTGGMDGTMRIWNIDDVIRASAVGNYSLYQ